jgi:hypothetical protein
MYFNIILLLVSVFRLVQRPERVVDLAPHPVPRLKKE